MTQAIPVYIWLLQLHKLDSANYLALLNESELERYHRFLDKKKSHEFACTRGSLRLALSQHARTVISATDIAFSYSNDSKPFCSNDESLCFNVSHSNGAAMIALNTQGMELGIDIEAYRRIDIPAMSKRFFSTTEQKLLAQIKQEDERCRAFFTIWARKEACVKAFGKGIATGLASFSVNVNDQACITENSDVIDPQGHWSLFKLHAPDNYAAALATCATANIHYQHERELCL